MDSRDKWFDAKKLRNGSLSARKIGRRPQSPAAVVAGSHRSSLASPRKKEWVEIIAAVYEMQLDGG